MKSAFSNELAIPGKYGPLTFDTTDIERADSRIHEVAFVTPMKAPELLATFNMAISRLSFIISKVELEKRYAERTADERRSVIVLDEAAPILKAKGLSKDSNPAGSADLRQAILDGDVNYQNLLDNVAELEALSELLRSQQKSIEMALYSVKDIIRSNQYIPKEETHGDAPEPEGIPTGLVPEWKNPTTSTNLRSTYKKPTL